MGTSKLPAWQNISQLSSWLNRWVWYGWVCITNPLPIIPNPQTLLARQDLPFFQQDLQNSSKLNPHFSISFICPSHFSPTTIPYPHPIPVYPRPIPPPPPSHHLVAKEDLETFQVLRLLRHELDEGGVARVVPGGVDDFLHLGMITCGGVRKMWGKPVESCGKYWEIIWEKCRERCGKKVRNIVRNISESF